MRHGRLPALWEAQLHLPAVVNLPTSHKLIILAALVAAFVMNGVPHWWD